MLEEFDDRSDLIGSEFALPLHTTVQGGIQLSTYASTWKNRF